MSARRMAGLTLVELMVAITVGLIMMNIVLQVYLGSRQSYLTQEAVSRIQENGRLAVEFLSRDARMSGYMGCLTGKELTGQSYRNMLNDPDGFGFDFGDLVQGYDVTAANPAPGVNALPGTDALVLRLQRGSGVTVTDVRDSANFEVNFLTEDADACVGNGGQPADGANGICPGDILMLTNCSRAVIFQADNVQPQAGNSSVLVVHASSGDPGNRAPVFPDEATATVGDELVLMRTVSYYIGTSGRTGRPGLFRLEDGGNPVELIEGVQSMQLRYGVDTNGDGMINEYRDASGVADWASVIAIRMQLLLQTPETNVLPEAQAGLVFNGEDIDTADRRLRQVFTATVALRNRMAD